MLNHNLIGGFARAAAARPASLALVEPGPDRVAIPYAALAERVAATAEGLSDLGLAPGDRVALLSRNSVDFVTAFLAALAGGMVVVPLNTRLHERELRHMLTDSGARLLVVEAELLAGAPALAELPGLRVVLAGQDGDGSLRALERGPASLRPWAAAAGDLASLMYTSGTTGAPKAVMLSHGSWNAVSDVATRVFALGPESVTVHAAALTHGSGFLLPPTLAAGAVNVVCARFDARTCWSVLREERVTTGFFVPSMIRMLLDADPGVELPDLRHLYYAGSPIDEVTLCEAAARFDGRLVQSFGQMEVPMFLSILDADDHARALGDRPDLRRSAGRPLPGVRLRVVADDGRTASPGEVGEIAVTAPQRMLGYWRRPDADAEAVRDGWLHTGDLGWLDDAGYLFLVDRKKDMIVTGGSNVYAREVEEVLRVLDGVADVAVIGLPDRLWGEAVTAVLVAREGAVPDEQRVLDACRDRLSAYKCPKRVVWRSELPRNASGKVLKRVLRDTLAAERVQA